jgi:hypothetical protein
MESLYDLARTFFKDKLSTVPSERKGHFDDAHFRRDIAAKEL